MPKEGELKYINPKKIRLKGHPVLNEKWVEDQIVNNPGILGLGELTLRDRQRIHARAGRLDLLLQDDENRRYAVEVQLGATDETHIIRTLEYWDIERKRYPQYDHCAVIVAEDVTSRFLNVISLFNGSVPIIAIQMTALEVGDGVGLLFTTVLSEVERGLVDEDEEVAEATDRNYWENRASKSTVQMADRLLEIVRSFAPDVELKFNKNYVGLARNGIADNFILFRPKKARMILEPRLEKSAEIDRLITDSGLDELAYDRRWNRYKLSLADDDLRERSTALRSIVKAAFEHNSAD